MNKRERLEKTFAGEQTDRIPVALWRHFPGDDQRAADLARSVLDFQKNYDWDFVNVVPANTFSVVDYGLQDQWQGDLTGKRDSLKSMIQRSLDWTDLRALDPNRGALGRQLECLRLVQAGLEDESPTLQTLFSPLIQAAQLAGQEVLLRHLRTRPDRLHTALNILTENTLRFINALAQNTQIAGICYVADHADYAALSEEEYRSFGLAYDLKILENCADKWWFNLLSLSGKTPMFKLVDTLPVQAINWQDQNERPNLILGKSQVRGAVCGGLSTMDHVHYGTPSTIHDAARHAIMQTNGRRFILSATGAVPITSPLSNLRAVRQTVNNIG